MPNILTIDTSSEACSVALQWGNDAVFRFTDQPRKHAELVLPMVNEVLQQAGVQLRQLDAIGFGRGPGSFTGLRIAAGTVQGLAYGADLPVLALSSLQGLAQRAFREFGWQQVHAAFDARMGELYWGSYRRTEAGHWQCVGAECVSAPANILQTAGIQQEPGWCGAGGGWVFRELLEPLVGSLQACEVRLLPHALDLLPLAAHELLQGNAISAEQVVPIYLRNDVAMKPSPR